MNLERSAGILLHPTSLPGPHGIGDLGPMARRWLDFLVASGCRVWQVLPLNPTGFGDSPYQSFSSFAGNPDLVSPELLVAEGLLEAADLAPGAHPPFPADRVDFGAIFRWKPGLLDRAHARFAAGAPGPERTAAIAAEFATFRGRHGAWLDDFALFMALKDAHGGRPWNEWARPLRMRTTASLARARREHAEAIERHAFRQFLFFRQWEALRAEARARGIVLVGDLPIFVAYDSADAWAHPDLFELDREGRPTVVAGVPPDYFAATGQLWGNPLYRWDRHAASGYAWWLDRLRAVFELVDIVRIDHFRGFAAYWEVPGDATTAVHGTWKPGPGAAFFDAVRAALGDLPIVAEDLGEITADVIALRDRFGLPGMKILEFAWSGPDNPFLPHHYDTNCVVYTGTHDNDTVRGWHAQAPVAERAFLERYLGPSCGSVAWDLVRLAWSSVARLAVAPPQDLLDLGSEARMNFPGTPAGNWTWRLPADFFDVSAPGIAAHLAEFNTLYGRAPGSKRPAHAPPHSRRGSGTPS